MLTITTAYALGCIVLLVAGLATTKRAELVCVQRERK
jgi:hypothetical protein